MNASSNMIGALAVGITTTGASLGSVHQQPTPTGAEIADRYTEVTGGMEAYDRVENRVEHATLALPAQGIEMDVTMYLAKPNRSYIIIDAPQVGTIEKGTTETVAWETSLMTGPVIREGGERAEALLNAIVDRWVYWRDAYESVEYAGETEVDGVACHLVEMTPSEGHAQTFFYAKDSGLIVRVDAVLDSQMGEIDVESYFADYREVDDILLPHEIRIIIMNQERVFTAKSYEHNVDLPDDRFDPPDDVRALLKEE